MHSKPVQRISIQPYFCANQAGQTPFGVFLLRSTFDLNILWGTFLPVTLGESSMKIKNMILSVFLIWFLSACQASSEPAVDAPINPTATPESTAIATGEKLTTEPAADTLPSFTPTFEHTPCFFEIPSNHIEGETVQCGFVIVPEDHRDPSGSTIKLATVIFKSQNEQGQPDPVIFLSGGPGEKTVVYTPALADHLASFNAERDLVFFDQRGVGSSQPALECPEFVAALFDILDEPDPGSVQRIVYESLMTCQERLVEEGHNLAVYNTAQNAADVQAIRLALGYEQVNLFGGSYGSLLAQAVMRDHPNHIRSVIIDSTVPMEKSLLIDIPTTAVDATLHLLDSCAADPDCSSAYPNLEHELYAVVERLNADPVPVTLVNPLDGINYDALLSGDMVFGNLVFFLYQTPIIPTLPQAIYNVAKGDFDLMIQLSSRKLAAYDAVSRGMTYSVLCTDDLLERTPEDYLEIRAAMPPALAGNTDPEDMIEYGYFAICENWPVEKADPAVRQPVTSDIPTLILEGEFDPVTPPEYGLMVAEHLSNSYFFEFPTIGHSVAVANECARSVAAAFIADPNTLPDASCREALEMAFVLPIDFDDIPLEAVTIPEFGIQALVPEGWTQVLPEYYVSPDTTIELVIKDNTTDIEADFLNRWGATEMIGELSSDGVNWTLYEASLPEHSVAGYAATAPSDEGFFMVLIVTTPAQQDKLYESVFIPVLEAFTYDAALKESGEIEDESINTETAPNLISFESETFDVRGLVPEGWVEAQPGIYARGSSPTDNTLVIQKSYPGMDMDALLEVLLPALHIEALPAPAGARETEAFVWTLYQTSINAPGVGTFTLDLALAELEGTPHLVLLQAEESEHAEMDMHNMIFVPVLDAFTPLE
jgi:pimeloyl-ACP methyl ester carboxylesterase